MSWSWYECTCDKCGAALDAIDLLSGSEMVACSSCGRRDGLVIERDKINPDHYKSHPSGVECIQVTEHMSFCLGNAVKYIWRAGLKGDALEDLEKARWYIEREINKIKEDRK